MAEIKLSNRDAALVKNNPGKSPYELQALGLSKPGFEKLMAQPNLAVTPIADSKITDDDPAGEETGGDGGNTAGADAQKQSDPALPGKLIPKITALDNSPAPGPKQSKPSTKALLPGQVLVTNPKGITVPMVREFAVNLVRNDSRYTINS